MRQQHQPGLRLQPAKPATPTCTAGCPTACACAHSHACPPAFALYRPSAGQRRSGRRASQVARADLQPNKVCVAAAGRGVSGQRPGPSCPSHPWVTRLSHRHPPRAPAACPGLRPRRGDSEVGSGGRALQGAHREAGPRRRRRRRRPRQVKGAGGEDGGGLPGGMPGGGLPGGGLPVSRIFCHLWFCPLLLLPTGPPSPPPARSQSYPRGLRRPSRPPLMPRRVPCPAPPPPPPARPRTS